MSLAPVADITSVHDVAPATTAGAERLGARRRRTRRRRQLTAAVAAADLVYAVAATVLLNVATPAPALVAALPLVWLTLLLACDGYQEAARVADPRRTTSVLRAGAVLAILCWIVPTVVPVPVPPRQLVALTLAMTAFGVLDRLAVDAWWARTRLALGGMSVLVAGEADAVTCALASMRHAPRHGWNVVGACVTSPTEDPELGVPVSVGVDDVAGAAAAADAEAVLLLPCRDLDPLSVRRLSWQLEAAGTRLYIGTGLMDVAPSRAAVVSVGDLSLVHLRERASSGAARVLKLVAERVGAVLLLLALAPFLAVVALVVRLDSPGPAVFRQVRVGRDGREFTMYKFRTMATDAESAWADLVEYNESEGAVLFKIKQDPRITRVGGFLRRYSIDEVPQLVNVALGSMALVGPRPALPEEVARYELDPRRRLSVRPGLTGLWQVSGRSDLSWADTVRLDLHYVDNWSLGLDLWIVCRTLHAVLEHDGAY